jgi:putative FmdB family regulatory protein
MPIFDFKCKECSEQKERLVKSGTETVECPSCGGRMEKQLSAPNVKFVGSGFYETDYKQGGKK